MVEVTEWWEEIGGPARHWLIIGKGPTFETHRGQELGRYTTIGINHVAREMPVDVASVVNPEVLGDCGDAIDRNSRYLLMPRYPPSVPGVVGGLLETYFDAYPVLEKLSRERRLVWYNLSSGPQIPGSPTVPNALFSSGILLGLLGTLGARRVRSLGVDGGTAYGASFADMAKRTRLANGVSSYDHQFGDMMRVIREFGMDYAPLGAAPEARLKLLLYRHLRPLYSRYLKEWLERGRVLHA